jgi:superfamily II RNA helicase
MKNNNNLKPQDILILLKICTLGVQEWFQHTLAEDLDISQSEISECLSRSKYSGLIDASRKHVNVLNLLELLEHGIKYVFPQQPGAIVRGVATAHSARPLANKIQSNENFVWAYARGNMRGQSIQPLYKTVPKVVLKDEKLHEMLALVDAIRVGKVREQQLAISLLKERLQHA